MNIDSNHQYLQSELPSDVFNSGTGDVKNYNGRAVKVTVNNNGTRGLQDLGDFNTYQNSKSITDALTAQNDKFNSMVTQGQNDVNDYLNRYKTDTANAVNESSNYYHLPEQTSVVNALNNRILNLQGNGGNNGAGASNGVGGFASNGQVGTALERNLLPQYSSAASNLNTSSQLAQTRAGQTLQPDVAEGSLLNDRLSREMTGFTTEQQNTLQALVSKLQSGVQLTQTELQTANELAKAQLAYRQALDTLSSGQNQYIETKPGDTLYNFVTKEHQKIA